MKAKDISKAYEIESKRVQYYKLLNAINRTDAFHHTCWPYVQEILSEESKNALTELFVKDLRTRIKECNEQLSDMGVDIY